MMPSSRSQSGAPTTCKLSALLTAMVAVEPVCERDIHGLSLDSRTARPGDLFLATPGTLAHGQEFIDAAVKAGAVAVAYELNAGTPTLAHLSVPLFGIANLSQRMGLIADRFYRHPSADLQVIGITGTNGKTSISHFLAQALSAEPNTPRCGIIGTLGNGLYGNVAMGSHTTPDALTLHALLNDMRAQGARSVVMEASSHGLEQGRVNHVAFDTAIFTNLSRDHLDYHLTMAAYAAAKRRLFLMPGLKKAVINTDDVYGRELLAALPASVHSVAYGLTPIHPELRSHAGVWGSNVQLSMNGFEMDVSSPWGEGHLCSPLLGRFNASNLLAVLAVLLLNGIPLAEALRRVAEINTIPGRMERFSAVGKPLVVVDYAHTPDALTQVLSTLREHLTRGARLWCVFGCGGERDCGKRPLMGAAAEQLADYVVITDDNPRHEDPLGIITDILAGLANPDGVYIQRLRAEAIAFAITYARPGDIVLVAGKGHESHQQIGAQKFPFSDRQRVFDLLNKAAQ